MSIKIRTFVKALNSGSLSLTVDHAVEILKYLKISISDDSADGIINTSESLESLVDFVAEIIQSNPSVSPVEAVKTFVASQGEGESDASESSNQVPGVQAQLHAEFAQAGVVEGHNLAQTYVQYACSTAQGLLSGAIAPGESHLGRVSTNFQESLTAYRKLLSDSTTPELLQLPSSVSAKNDPVSPLPLLDVGGTEALLELAHSKSQPQLAASR